MRELGVVWALGILVKGTALLLCVFLVAASLRRASAGLRHLVWSGGIVALLVLPLASITLPWRLPVIAPSAYTLSTGGGSVDIGVVQRAVGSLGSQAGLRPRPEQSAAPTSPSLSRASSSPAFRLPSLAVVTRALLAVWIAGALFVLGRLMLGAILVRRIVRRATLLDSPDWTRPLLEAADRLALDRVPRLVVSDRLPMPFACGLWQPAIVLPSGAHEWTDRRRRAVLFHELAHVRRFDLPVNALGQLASAVYWLHPLVWVAVRKLRMESERACDDLVLGVGTRPSEYADHLLQIVCRAARARTPAVALPMAERREFEGRMLAILERNARRDAPSPRHAATLGVFALALLVPLAALGPAREVSQASTSMTDPQIESTAAPSQSSAVPSQLSARKRSTTVMETRRVSPPVHQPAPKETGVAPETLQVIQEDQPGQSQSPGDSAKAKVVAALIGATGDSVASVREDAVYALGELEARSAVTALGTRLARDPDPSVRKMAAWSLGQIESHDATPALSAAAQGDAIEAVRAMAIWALGQLEDVAAVPALMAALKDNSAEVRGRAAWAIGSIEPKQAPEGLVAALRDGAAPVRVRAAWALGQIGDDAAVAGLTQAMKDSEAEVRRAAFWALGQMGEAAQPALLEALKDADPQVRARAARALAGGHMDPWPWPWPMPIVK